MDFHGTSLSLCAIFFRIESLQNVLIISPGLVFVQKAFFWAYLQGKLILGGACYREEYCISKWVWLANKNSLNSSKQLTVTVHGFTLCIFGRAYYYYYYYYYYLFIYFFFFGGGLIIRMYVQPLKIKLIITKKLTQVSRME